MLATLLAASLSPRARPSYNFILKLCTLDGVRARRGQKRLNQTRNEEEKAKMSNFPEMEYKAVEQPIKFPENGTLDLLRAVYRNPDVALMTRMRAAIAALQFEHPKLAVTAMVNEGDLADQLDRAIQASRKIIEAKPLSISSEGPSDDSNTKPMTSNSGKPVILDRRYRRW